MIVSHVTLKETNFMTCDNRNTSKQVYELQIIPYCIVYPALLTQQTTAYNIHCIS